MNIDRLYQILSYKRPHGSKAEAEMVKAVITSQYADHALLGPMGNVVIEVGEGSKTLFSCHTDTVHKSEGTQRILYDKKLNVLHKKDGECLGADDGAGVWLLLHMIDAGVPGTYVFHRGEERGGIGSGWLADNEADWLAGFDRAIAFDRRGSTSVITHQFGGVCCSEEFAEDLAAQLGMAHMADPGGSFTDTANYTHLIPECTNVSIGYSNEHSGNEQLDMTYLLELADAVTRVEWESLTTARDPKARLAWTVGKGFGSFDTYSLDDLEDFEFEDLLEFCEASPDTVAYMLADFFDERRGFGSLTRLEADLDRQAEEHLSVGLL